MRPGLWLARLFDQRRRDKRCRRWWLSGCLLVAAGTGQAHLLNMSRAELTLLPASGAEVEAAGKADAGSVATLRLELDLTRALGSSVAFHAASLVRDPLANATLIELAQQAARAVELQINDRPVRWEAESLALPGRSLADYQSPAIWPRATLQLRGFHSAGSTAATATENGIRLRFQPEFPFEEPIAVTVRGLLPTPSMTRWLVAEQWFPALSPALLASLGATGPPVTAAVDQSTSLPWGTLSTFVRVGLTHVLPGGWDHLAFVVGLLLLASSPSALLRLLLWYTAAHTIAFLVLALRWVPPPGPWVEWLILLSISWAGASVLRQRTTGGSPNGLVVSGFGLVHGLGFASSLDALPLSLSGRLSAIVGFNLGVDAAQLSAALVLWWLLTREFAERPLRHYTARPLAFVLILGSTCYLLKLLFFPS